MKKIHIASLSALAVFLALVAAPVKARADSCSTLSGNLVANCGFETGTFSGWTTANASNSGLHIDNTDQLPGGSYDASWADKGEDGYLYQDLTTAPGTTYTITYYVDMQYANSSSYLKTYWGGTSGNTDGTLMQNLSGVANSSYTEYTFTETATSSSTQIMFDGNANYSYVLLDNISVVPVSAPEPSTLLLLAMGLLGIALVMRRRLREEES